MGGSLRLLVDTHVLVWLLMSPSRIPAQTLTRLRDPTTELLVSAITAFELATKYRLGKLPEVSALLLGYDSALAQLGTVALPVSARHATTAGQLDWHHRDPFDRILAAQCLTEGVSLVTADAAFSSLGQLETIWGE